MVASMLFRYLWCLILFFCLRGVHGACNVTALYECFKGDPAQNITFSPRQTDAENCRYYQYFGKCLEPYSYYCYGVDDWVGILDEYQIMINKLCYPSKPCNMTLVNHCSQTILDPVIGGITSNDLSEFRPRCKDTFESYKNCSDNMDQHCMYDSDYFFASGTIKSVELVCSSPPECDLYKVKSCTSTVKSIFRSTTSILLTSEKQNQTCSAATEYFMCIGDMFTSCATSSFKIPMSEQADFYEAEVIYNYFDNVCRQYKTDLNSLASSCLNYFWSPFFSSEKGNVEKCNLIPAPKDANRNPLHCKTVTLFLECVKVAMMKVCDYNQVTTFLKYIGTLRRKTSDIFYKTTCEAEFQAITTISPPSIPPPVTPAPGGCDLKKMVDCSSSLKLVTLDMAMWFLPKTQHMNAVCSQSTELLNCLNPLMTACQMTFMTMSFDALMEYMQTHGLVIQVDHVCNKFYDGLSGNAKYCSDKVNDTINQALQECNKPLLGSQDMCDSIRHMVDFCLRNRLNDICDSESLPVVLDYMGTLQRNIIDTFQGTTCQKDYEASLPTTTTTTPKPVRITTTRQTTTASATTIRATTSVQTSDPIQNGVGFTTPGSINSGVSHHISLLFISLDLLMIVIFI